MLTCSVARCLGDEKVGTRCLRPVGKAYEFHVWNMKSERLIVRTGDEIATADRRARRDSPTAKTVQQRYNRIDEVERLFGAYRSGVIR